MKKKILAFFLTIVLFCPFAFSNVKAATQVDIILAKARSLIGSTAYNGYCQRFVRVCYEAVGITGNVASATVAGNYWIRSTSREIPVGATVYFTGSTAYGHVGIYTGNGRMIHALGTVREEPISDYYWARYRGYGFQGGVRPAGVYFADSTPPVAGNVSITRNGKYMLTLSCSASDNIGVASVVFVLKDEMGHTKNIPGAFGNGLAVANFELAQFGFTSGRYEAAVVVSDSAGNKTQAGGGVITLDFTPPKISGVEITKADKDGYYVSFNSYSENQTTIKAYYKDGPVRKEAKIEKLIAGNGFYVPALFFHAPEAEIRVKDEFGFETTYRVNPKTEIKRLSITSDCKKDTDVLKSSLKFNRKAEKTHSSLYMFLKREKVMGWKPSYDNDADEFHVGAAFLKGFE